MYAMFEAIRNCKEEHHQTRLAATATVAADRVAITKRVSSVRSSARSPEKRSTNHSSASNETWESARWAAPRPPWSTDADSKACNGYIDIYRVIIFVGYIVLDWPEHPVSAGWQRFGPLLEQKLPEAQDITLHIVVPVNVAHIEHEYLTILGTERVQQPVHVVVLEAPLARGKVL